MLRFARRHKTWSILSAVAVLAAAAGVVLWSTHYNQQATVRTRDAMINVVDGPQHNEHVRLDTTLYLPAHTPAPAILVAHGFGGSKDSVATQARDLAQRGFVVLAYSARGFGHSTGKIALNSPNYEVADAKQLVDWLAKQPEVAQNAPGDPKIGVTGASYGGALALMLAAADPRIGAVVPVMTYNDLASALLPNAATTPGAATTPAASTSDVNGVFKRAWAGLLYSAGASPAALGAAGGAVGVGGNPGTAGQSTPQQPPTTGGPAGASGASSPACGRFRPDICQAYTEVATTGKASEQTIDLLRRNSPVSVASKITAPTLLIQGEQDTLFGLDQADATARQIVAAGGHVQVQWFAGGHDGGGPGPAVQSQIADFFQLHLTGHGPKPGSGFSYAVQGAFRTNGSSTTRMVSASAYPGLGGAPATQQHTLALSGPPQSVLTPPGGSPASVSTLPGLSSLLGSASGAAASLAGGLTVDPPGQAARFTTQPLGSQLLIAGSPQVTLRVSAVPGQSQGDAVLFAKLYDIAPNGRVTLPGGAVAPLRVTGLPADGQPVDVTVTLPGVVQPVAPGHRLQLVVATTDQAYDNPVQPASHVVALAGDGGLSIPVVPGTGAAGSPLPTTALVGIAAVLAVAVLAAVLVAVRRRRVDIADPELVDVPLVIRNLKKSYPGGLTAVNDLTFRVERGQVLGLLGPNGAGKTTTLRMLMGLMRPSEGEIRVFGHRIHPGAPVLSRIGSFVEGPGFLPHLSGAANLRLYWAATGRPADNAHVEEALEIAGLGKALRRRVGTYSQGMRQRLAIAQAMLGLPDLLVLDEPTNGLDPPQIHHMRAVLRGYAATGRTVVVSSHLLGEVEQTCTHVVVMHRGALVAAGAVADVVVAGGGESTFRVDQPEAAAEVLRPIGGVSRVHVDGPLVHADLNGLPPAEAVRALVTAGVAVEQVGPRRRLEDAFMQLVGEEVVR